MISLPTIVKVPHVSGNTTYCVSDAGKEYSFTSTDCPKEAEKLLIKAFDRAIMKTVEDLNRLIENKPCNP